MSNTGPDTTSEQLRAEVLQSFGVPVEDWQRETHLSTRHGVSIGWSLPSPDRLRRLELTTLFPSDVTVVTVRERDLHHLWARVCVVELDDVDLDVVVGVIGHLLGEVNR